MDGPDSSKVAFALPNIFAKNALEQGRTIKIAVSHVELLIRRLRGLVTRVPYRRFCVLARSGVDRLPLREVARLILDRAVLRLGKAGRARG